MDRKTFILIALAAGAFAALAWWSMQKSNTPMALGAPAQKAISTPLWSNEERWEIRRGEDRGISSVTIHREVAGR